MNNLEKIGTEAVSFAKRHSVMIAIIFASILGYWLISQFQTSNSEKLNKLYSEMQQSQDSIANAIEKKYAGANIPRHLINLEASDAIQKYTLTPVYQNKENEARKLEAEANSENPYKGFLIATGILIMSAMLTGLILYCMTAVNFIDIIVRGEDSKYSEAEAKSTIDLIGLIFKYCVIAFTLIESVILFVGK